MKAGIVIGLGGLGVSVVHRIRGLLSTGPGGKVPDNLRLLAFDLLRPTATTGRLGQPYYFLIRLPVGEAGLPATRQAARQVLLNDLEKGAPSSLILRGLALNMETLRRAGFPQVDVFLVSSTFGVSGSAWLVDMAYLCRHSGQGRIAVNIHAVLLSPESCQAAFQIDRGHQLTNFAVLKELESFQKPRDWGSGFPLYAGKHLAGLPGLLTGSPFTTIQIVDGQELGGLPDQTAVPAAADGILCQLDEQAAQILRQTAETRTATATGRNCFSSFGVQGLSHPTRLLVEAGVQRAVLGLIECLLPVSKDPSDGRPRSLESPPVLIPSDPYNDIGGWLGDYGVSGIMTDLLYQVGLSGPNALGLRQDWVERLADRDLPQWKATVFQVEGAEELLPTGGGNPESVIPVIQRHFRAYLRALANKAADLKNNPAGPQEYLGRLERTLTDYIADLGRAEELLKRKGKHSDADAVRLSVDETRRDWEQKKDSSWSRLFPQRVEEAQERYLAAKQVQVGCLQREVLLGAARKSASLMLTLTRKLLDHYHYYTRALALSRDSLYNLSLDHLQRIQRELDTEGAVRSQQLVVDEKFEERQVRLIFDQMVDRIFPDIQGRLLDIENHVDWLADSIQIRALIADPDAPEALDGQIDLADLSRDPEETALILARWFNRTLGDPLASALGENSILNFIHYLNPRADQLGSRLVERSGPLAKTIVPTAAQVAFLFTPDPDVAETSAYMRELIYELYQQLGELYQVQNGDPDRILLFRRYDSLTLDNLVTFHNSVPERLDPAELKPYVLWIL